MRSLLPLFAVAAVLLAATPMAGQQTRTIGPEMTTDEVRSVLGPPQVVREADGWTYFFYTNRCLPRCGTDDTVFFRDGRVVTAVLHSPSRRYAGPPAPSAIAAVPRATVPTTRPQGGATVTGIRVRVPQPQPAEEPPVNLGVIRGRMVDTSRPGAAAPPADGPAATPAPASPMADQRQREQRLEPTTVRPETQTPAAAPADGRTREERLEPNTVRRPPRQ
jgi:hypothetical protein